jgi:hypothetical protein
MLLGKKYTRIKRKLNATEAQLYITTSSGITVRLPRKLNMLGILSLREKVNLKAVNRETDKFVKRLKEQSV